MELSDAAIVERVLAGDGDAYALLVARYRDRYVDSRCTCSAVGRMRRRRCRMPSSVDTGRSRGRGSEEEVRVLADADPHQPVSYDGCGRRARRERDVRERRGRHAECAPNHPADQRAWREEIQRALEQIDRFSGGILAQHVEDRSYEEIAELTGVGVSALKMRVKRACDRLRDRFRRYTVSELDDLMIARVARELRKPERIDPAFDGRVMAEIRAGVPRRKDARMAVARPSAVVPALQSALRARRRDGRGDAARSLAWRCAVSDGANTEPRCDRAGDGHASGGP